MAKTIAFVEKAFERAREGRKSVTVKDGNLTISFEGNTLTVQHFAHVILEVDFDKAVSGKELWEGITRWHIQSITDANYIGTILSKLWQSYNFRTGYRPVNGGGYFEVENGEEWVTVGGEY